MPHCRDAESGRDDGESAAAVAAPDRFPAFVAGGGGAVVSILDTVDGVADVEGDVVPRAHEVLEGGVVGRLHVVAILQGEVLLGQLVDQLLVAVFLAVRVQFRNLLRGKETHPILRSTSRQALKWE